MTTIYKFTDKDGYTRRGESGEQRWTVGAEVAVEWGGELCDAGCLHAYADPLLAVLMDPAHGEYLPGGRLWEGDGNVRKDDGSKLGCDRIILRQEVDIPVVTIEQRRRFGILAAMEVYEDAEWLEWTRKWLSEEDRSEESTSAAAAVCAAAAARAAAGAKIDLLAIARKAME